MTAFMVRKNKTAEKNGRSRAPCVLPPAKASWRLKTLKTLSSFNLSLAAPMELKISLPQQMRPALTWAWAWAWAWAAVDTRGSTAVDGESLVGSVA